MTDFDFVVFTKAFQRVMTAFRLKLKPADADELTRTYFKVLDAHPIDSVLAAGKACLAKHRTFPKAADWLAELAAVPVACPVDRRQMTVTELDELERAAALRFQDHPCLCSACCRAGVDNLPLRYVPTLRLDDEEERAFNPRRGHLEVVGHWAHGDELAAWYAARAAFFALKTTRSIAGALVTIFGEREVGVEG